MDMALALHGNALAPVLEGRSGLTTQYRRLTICAPFSPTLRRSKAGRLKMTSTDAEERRSCGAAQENAMSANRKSERPLARWGRDHLEQLLDQALADSFPASDPVAIDFGTPIHDHATNTEAGPQSVPRTQSHSRRQSQATHIACNAQYRRHTLAHSGDD
jgi:hypothetical protein